MQRGKPPTITLADDIAEREAQIQALKVEVENLKITDELNKAKISWAAVTTAAQRSGITITDAIRMLDLDPKEVLRIQEQRRRPRKVWNEDADNNADENNGGDGGEA